MTGEADTHDWVRQFNISKLSPLKRFLRSYILKSSKNRFGIQNTPGIFAPVVIYNSYTESPEDGLGYYMLYSAIVTNTKDIGRGPINVSAGNMVYACRSPYLAIYEDLRYTSKSKFDVGLHCMASVIVYDSLHNKISLTGINIGCLALDALYDIKKIYPT